MINLLFDHIALSPRVIGDVCLSNQISLKVEPHHRIDTVGSYGLINRLKIETQLQVLLFLLFFLNPTIINLIVL